MKNSSQHDLRLLNSTRRVGDIYDNVGAKGERVKFL